MQTVLIVLHLMIVVSLVIVVLLQRSEGGALGIGGGGGGFLTGRGTANVLTRTTAILALCFFGTSLILAILAGRGGSGGSVIDTLAPPATAPGPAQPVAPGPDGGGQGGVLDLLRRQGGGAQPEAPQPQPTGPQVPQSQ